MALDKSPHTFHIPVMGLAYTIDSPVRVAHYGISSVISIIDDELMEKMNAFYSNKLQLAYEEITTKVYDYRAERVTSYLNLMDKIVKQKFEAFKHELTVNKSALENYIAMLPNQSDIKKGLQQFVKDGIAFGENIRTYLENHLSPGSIDVNIMTKVDKDNFIKNEQLPVAFNDAHASLRGFANSTVNSSVVLSAGMNPRLYAYMENFTEFYPDSNNTFKKKIVLKVSDFRSAMIQGSFLAKKGLWVSEYRIESGLNCGGHAFATDGYLLGPILEEFKQKKEQLITAAYELMSKALSLKGIAVNATAPELKITVQGGVGTAAEHSFLLNYYEVDSVGWGSPFLLVPEATSVDQETRDLLAKAKEDDLYLSQLSPLGIPFNTIKGSTNEHLRHNRLAHHKSGSSCPKKYLALSKEYSEKGICTASRRYQDFKLEELNAARENLSDKEYEKRKFTITEKACLCVGLANASYLENDIKIKGEAQGVVICPGPNMAYFDRQVSLAEMTGHIYGNNNIITRMDRPNMFVKELTIYIDYFRNEISQFGEEITASQVKKMNGFKKNLLDGIEYYAEVLSSVSAFRDSIQKLEFCREVLLRIEI